MNFAGLIAKILVQCIGSSIIAQMCASISSTSSIEIPEDLCERSYLVN